GRVLVTSVTNNGNSVSGNNYLLLADLSGSPAVQNTSRGRLCFEFDYYTDYWLVPSFQTSDKMQSIASLGTAGAAGNMNYGLKDGTGTRYADLLYNRWYKIKFVFNYDTKETEYYLDNEKVG